MARLDIPPATRTQITVVNVQNYLRFPLCRRVQFSPQGSRKRVSLQDLGSEVTNKHSHGLVHTAGCSNDLSVQTPLSTVLMQINVYRTRLRKDTGRIRQHNDHTSRYWQLSTGSQLESSFRYRL